jgi:hypothetical protein
MIHIISKSKEFNIQMNDNTELSNNNNFERIIFDNKKEIISVDNNTLEFLKNSMICFDVYLQRNYCDIFCKKSFYSRIENMNVTLEKFISFDESINSCTQESNTNSCTQELLKSESNNTNDPFLPEILECVRESVDMYKYLLTEFDKNQKKYNLQNTKFHQMNSNSKNLIKNLVFFNAMKILPYNHIKKITLNCNLVTLIDFIYSLRDSDKSFIEDDYILSSFIYIFEEHYPSIYDNLIMHESGVELNSEFLKNCKQEFEQENKTLKVQ